MTEPKFGDILKWNSRFGKDTATYMYLHPNAGETGGWTGKRLDTPLDSERRVVSRGMVVWDDPQWELLDD